MFYEISNDLISVKINDFGAEISSVIFKNKERVWQNDNGTWAGKSPILFPVCGNSSIIIDRINYDMPRHGFARRSVFDCIIKERESVVFQLFYNEKTFAVYPFRFELLISYSLKDNSIMIESVIKNIDDRSVRFALGRHDSFSLDNTIGNYKICFNKAERFLSRRTDDKGKLVDEFDDFGDGKELRLPEKYLVDGRSMIFGNINSDRVFLKTLDNCLVAEFLFQDVNNLLIWHPNETKMICIEPWSTLPDQSGKDLDLFEKDGFITLEVKEEKRIKFEIKYY